MFYYKCLVVGVDYKKALKFHPTSLRRLTAFALSIHIPFILWLLAGYVISKEIFNLTEAWCVAIAITCAGIIYLVDRIIILTPSNLWINSIRIIIGICVAVLGASMIDIFIFDKEIKKQLLIEDRNKLEIKFDNEIKEIKTSMNASESEYKKLRDQAICEANGTCGSRQRNLGSIYIALARLVEIARSDYEGWKKKYEDKINEKNKRLDEFDKENFDLKTAGLLVRLEALGRFVGDNKYGLGAWILFFVLVVLLEALVIIVKMIFKETVDDYIERTKEKISQDRAEAYIKAIKSPESATQKVANSFMM